nr:uncharacterized protein LOC101242913 [Ciona intestinalis]|eukprot:XP_004226924.2 uncharacterized protein LOC101242913 [Ciona intestinalis]
MFISLLVSVLLMIQTNKAQEVTDPSNATVRPALRTTDSSYSNYGEYGSAYTTSSTDDEDYTYDNDQYDIDEQYKIIDEESKANVPAKDWFTCDSGQLYLTKNKKCDGYPDCYDCSDEIGCVGYGEKFFSCYGPDSKRGDFTSYNYTNPYCVPRYKFCDGVQDCMNDRDEAQIGFGFKCQVYKHFQTCILPNEMLNDGKIDCEDKSDEREVGKPTNQTSFDQATSSEYFRCIDPNVSVSIFHNQVCDGIIDCPDLSDECLCQIPYSDSIRQICDNVKRPNLWVATRNYNSSCKNCETGEICIDQESGGKCVKTSKICDNLDRKLRHDVCLPREVSEAAAVIDCISIDGSFRMQKARMCDGRPECLFGVDECDTSCFGDDGNSSLPAFCKLLDPEHGYKCNDTESKNNPMKIVRPCDGVWDCDNNEDEMDCPTRYPCYTSLSRELNISTHVTEFTYDVIEACDGTRNCPNGADEMTSQCSFIRPLSCTGGGTSAFDCDVTDDCDSKVKTSLELSGVTGNYSLLENLAVQIFLIVLSASGFLGNCFGLIVAIANTLSLSRAGCSKYFLALLQESVFYSTVSMSKALFSGCLAFVLLQDGDESSPCYVPKYEWRVSLGCSAVGAICCVTIFVSWFALAAYVSILSASTFCGKRHHDVTGKPPRQAGLSKLWLGVTFALLVVIWVPVTTAILVWTSGMQTHAWVNISSAQTILPGEVADEEFAVNLAGKVASISGQVQFNAPMFSWENFAEFVNQNAPTLGLKVLGTFGFYSHSDSCMPLVFIKPGTTGGGEADRLSVFLLISALVLVTYCLIGTIVNVLCSTRRRRNSRKRLRKSKTLRFPMCFSTIEFFTWIPVIVSFFINFYIPGTISAGTFELLALTCAAMNCGVLSVCAHIWGRVYYSFNSPATPSDESGFDEARKVFGLERKVTKTPENPPETTMQTEITETQMLTSTT